MPVQGLLYSSQADWLQDLGHAVGAERSEVHVHSHPLARNASSSWTLHHSPCPSPLDVRRLSQAQQLKGPHTALTPALVLTLCSPCLPSEELGISSAPHSPPCQALSLPACSASERCTRVIQSPITSGFCPMSVHWIFSSHFLPVLKLLEQTDLPAIARCVGDKQPNPHGQDGMELPDTTASNPGWGSLPPAPGVCTSRAAKPPVRSSCLCHPVPAQPVLSDTDRAVMLTSRQGVWLHAAVLVTARRPGLLLAQPFKLTPYVPYFPACFVTTEISDSLLLQNKK
ncbi:KIAA0040 ortholog [Columba livia]|uniref:KIAA0040 ortholog n=1 Tax=Columba livia TaxID=8932 RepID=A0A2I0MCK2_COLLI|nr:KIAA0040 ortholog [Columba livia]